jgi:2-keto-3-deoxy-L-fuconate dehydrogenase
MTDLQGLRAIVTGGASGIGRATVELLRARGASTASLDRTAGTHEHDVVADVTDDASVGAAVALAEERLGGIDILVNNVGIGAIGDVSTATDEEWRLLWDVNVVGLARVTRAALPALRRSEHAAIVNTSSVVATVGVPQRAVYAATKGAVLSLTLAMAADLVGDGIRVNAVTPGTADTPWINRLLDQADDPESAREALRQRQPIGRLVTPSEVASAIVYLASPAAASTTGTVLPVDGGMDSLRLPR